MRLVIVPNVLRDKINAAIDKELDGRPIEEAERQDVFDKLLAFWDEHGAIPDFKLTKL
jgi:hypothetical protein